MIEVASGVTELIGNLKAKNMNGELEMKPREIKKIKSLENDRMKERESTITKEKIKYVLYLMKPSKQRT